MRADHADIVWAGDGHAQTEELSLMSQSLRGEMRCMYTYKFEEARRVSFQPEWHALVRYQEFDHDLGKDIRTILSGIGIA